MRFDLSSREFPASGKRSALASLRAEYFAVFDDDCADDVDDAFRCLMRGSLAGWSTTVMAFS